MLCSQLNNISSQKTNEPQKIILGLFKFLLFSYRKEVGLINRFNNKDGHRVCDYSDDRKTVEIARKGCITRITANPDGSLNIVNVTKQPN